MSIEKKSHSEKKQSIDKNVTTLEKSPFDIYGSKTFDEEPFQVKADISTLKHMVLEDQTLYVPTDDVFLLKFLRSVFFDCEEAYHLIHKYYKMKIDYPNMYELLKPSQLLHVFENSMFTLLSNRDEGGRTIMIFRPGVWEPDNCPIIDMLRGIHLSLELAIRDEETQKNGIIFISDWKGFGLRQAKYCRPTCVRIGTKLMQECFPARFVAFHVVNEHRFFELALIIIKPFLNDNFKKQMYFHGNNWESLHQYISPDILPEEFGGTQPPFDNSTFVRNLLRCEDEILEYQKYGVENNSK